MKHAQVHITGIGSVSTFGPAKGRIPQQKSELRTITAWPTPGPRKAFIVEPFTASKVIPGLKTRRLDRLSVWALVASSLALQDAGIQPGDESLSKGGVVFGTGFGPTELTSAFCGSVAEFGCAKADAIVFPETLDNSAACHVAKTFGMKGPNITLSCRGISGEAAIIRAASILESGEAELVIVMAGDTLVQALYDYYESTRILASDCFGREGFRRPNGFIPGEGLAAFVLESDARYRNRGAKLYGCYRSGRMAGDPTATSFSWGKSSETIVDLINDALGSAAPADVQWIVASGNGSRTLDTVESHAIREVFGIPGAAMVIAPKKKLGEFDGNALLRFALAISSPQKFDDGGVSGKSQPAQKNLLLLLGASTGGGRAAITFELPGETGPVAAQKQS